jgi:hypothetical protein
VNPFEEGFFMGVKKTIGKTLRDLLDVAKAGPKDKGQPEPEPKGEMDEAVRESFEMVGSMLDSFGDLGQLLEDIDSAIADEVAHLDKEAATKQASEKKPTKKKKKRIK